MEPSQTILFFIIICVSYHVLDHIAEREAPWRKLRRTIYNDAAYVSPSLELLGIVVVRIVHGGTLHSTASAYLRLGAIRNRGSSWDSEPKYI